MRVMTLLCTTVLACGASCATTSPQPTGAFDLAPLPPPSPTAIGLLRGHDRELGLSAAQLEDLRRLDDELQVGQRELERELAAVVEVDRSGGRPPGRGPRGGRPVGGPGGGGMGGPGGGGMGGPGGGGMGGPGGGGMGGPGGGGMGGPGGGGMGGPGGGEARPAPRRAPPPLTGEQRAEVDRIHDQMVENERTMVARALDLLDADQRARAEALLDERSPERPLPPVD